MKFPDILDVFEEDLPPDEWVIWVIVYVCVVLIAAVGVALVVGGLCSVLSG